jgi:hypothetical protein
MAAIANVTVHFSVWSDARFDTLAILLGVDKYSAIGRMTRLWSECTDIGIDMPPVHLVIGCLGSAQAIEALVQSGLGEKMGDQVRIKGCSDRIDWLRKKRESGSKGGRARVQAQSKHHLSITQANAQASLENFKHSSSITQANAQPSGIQLYSSPESESSSIPESGARNLEKTKKAAAAHRSPNAGAQAGARVPQPLREDWKPNAEQQQRSLNLSLNLPSEIVKFRAHAASTNRKFTDEDAAFSIWLEKSGERKMERTKTNQPTTKPRARMNIL